MARRRRIELPANVAPFDRTVEQWRALGAPAWVFDLDAASEAYFGWALSCYGGGHDSTDPAIRRYFVEMIWMQNCVKPQWLWHAGVLLPAEVRLFTGDRWARWGRPGRCRSQQLNPEADVPVWLACCRQEPRHGSA